MAGYFLGRPGTVCPYITFRQGDTEGQVEAEHEADGRAVLLSSEKFVMWNSTLNYINI